MKREKRDIRKHLFICTNMKESGECCGAKDSLSLVRELKNIIKEKNLKSEIRVSASSCLGPCSQGISAVLYPNNEQFTQINSHSAKELFAILTDSE